MARPTTTSPLLRQLNHSPSLAIPSPTEVVRGKDGKAVESAASQTAAYGLPMWKQVLNNTTVTVGCDNIFGADPPHAIGLESGGAGFPDFIYDSLGRFVYVSLTKKF